MATTTRLMPAAIDGVGARPGAANVRAGFEVQIERGPSRLIAGLFDRQHLGMLHAVVGVSAATDDLCLPATPTRRPPADSARPAQRPAGELQRLLHESSRR